MTSTRKLMGACADEREAGSAAESLLACASSALDADGDRRASRRWFETAYLEGDRTGDVSVSSMALRLRVRAAGEVDFRHGEHARELVGFAALTGQRSRFTDRHDLAGDRHVPGRRP